MSAKKKNPLKDLSAFLAHKQEASQVPAPKKLSDTKEFMEKKPIQIGAVSRPAKITMPADVEAATIKTLLLDLAQKEGDAFRNEFYHLILEVTEQLDNNQPADKMLINTVLYLANQDNWKEAVKEYWMNKN